MSESVEVKESGLVIVDKRKLGTRKSVTNPDEAAEILGVEPEDKEPIIRIWPQTPVLSWAANVQRCTQEMYDKDSETSPQTTRWLNWYLPYWLTMNRLPA